ncbi:hypothetical protein FRC14_002199 [Serendipita sp. 396]|nr:hypothetical protein FRC14_002199 [Serendipita sp. 396]KAG8787955.1 hypothetical protein FRC15_007016 [Serendipita sp. 397]KAG8803465.1 hypothetical protein FRC16_005135 [Serendipita sp. 398]KAG8822054.1 hypothetical protein FRC18_011115 [Serendipita sp. 400]KAG8844111.1 hypothetical protein FRB91_002849 [Serendipita sp. 411]KAG8873793.1 hypothetical protein FRC20_007447 [Serendipita sp. 405]
MDTPVTDLLHLNALPSNPDSTLSSFAVTHAPPDLINSVWATLKLLARATPSLSYAPTHFSLISPNTVTNSSSVYRVQTYLEELTRAAFEVSSSLSCGSMLAGGGSETDEYGDVGVWVGSLEKRDPQDVLQNLGLDEWVKSNGGKIVQMPPSPSPLPSSLTSSTSQSMVSETPKMHAESLSKLLNNLESTMEFRIHGLPGGTVLYFLVGQLSERTGGFSPEDGYAGLVGVGVMADGDEE